MMGGQFYYHADGFGGEIITYRLDDGTEYGGFETRTLTEIRLKPGLEAPILLNPDEREGG